MSERVPGKVIYIGSIPYDQTEEQVLDIAKSIGPVINLKMMFDKETGKSKGFAFVEYPDVETASSAVRNLNNYSIGNRSLKCDFSNENSLSSNGSNNNQGKNKQEDTLPPLPSGIQLPQGVNYAESISKTLQTLDDTRKIALIKDAKDMARRNPVLMDELLTQCPQLAYALVETLLITGKATPEDITQTLINIDTTDSSNGTNGAEIKQEDENQQQEEEELDDEKLALIKQVLAISDEELAEIPEDQRASIVQIKENAKNGVYGNII